MHPPLLNLTWIIVLPGERESQNTLRCPRWAASPFTGAASAAEETRRASCCAPGTPGGAGRVPRRPPSGAACPTVKGFIRVSFHGVVSLAQGMAVSVTPLPVRVVPDVSRRHPAAHGQSSPGAPFRLALSVLSVFPNSPAEIACPCRTHLLSDGN